MSKRKQFYLKTDSVSLECSVTSPTSERCLLGEIESVGCRLERYHEPAKYTTTSTGRCANLGYIFKRNPISNMLEMVMVTRVNL